MKIDKMDTPTVYGFCCTVSFVLLQGVGGRWKLTKWIRQLYIVSVVQ